LGGSNQGYVPAFWSLLEAIQWLINIIIEVNFMPIGPGYHKENKVFSQVK